MSDFYYKANYDAARDRAEELIRSKKAFISRESLEYIFPELKPNVPDRIYIQENDPSMRYGVNQDADINGMHEYIRKNALLERLEKVAASYKKRSDEGELVWQNMCGINEAIGILNEM